jgi:hypothetical protein
MADVAATIAQWSSTTGSNSPSGATNIGSGLDDNLREIQGVIVRSLSHKGADIASATTTDIGAVEGLAHDITGTTTITGLGTVRAGIWKVLKFEGALTLTHNATSLILPGAANITTADGDVAVMISEGAGNWRCVSYTKADGRALVGALGSITTSGLTMNTARMLLRTTAGAGAIEEGDASSVTTNFVSAASDTVAGKIEVAIQSEMEAASSTTLAVTPGRLQYHPGVAKVWGRFDTAGALTSGHNISSITDSGIGIGVVNFTTAFSSATNYASQFNVIDNAGSTSTTYPMSDAVTPPAAGSNRWRSMNYNWTAGQDPTVGYMYVAHGDQ